MNKRNVTRVARDQHQKEFVRIFQALSGRYSRREIWQDLVTLTAISIANIVDHDRAESRSKTYKTIAGKYSPAELDKMAEALSYVVTGMEANPDQDFLGELYMALELGNDSAGQFFTPYDVCRCMAEINSGDVAGRVEKDGWISVCDPACGAGATLVAFANHCMRQNVNYQTSVLFVAQDIDYIVGMMCYIQLSLLGCPGYVVIGNTLTNPSTSYDKRGLLPRDGQEIWFTPMYYRDVWVYRKMWASIDLVCRNSEPVQPTEMPVAKEPELPQYPETKGGQLSFF